MPIMPSSALLLILGLLIGLSCSLNPRDPNVCSLWESFTTSVKESYFHPYDHVTEEPCVAPTITYKTAYRQAVKTDYRKRYQCCPGYYESRDKCVPRCTKECVHGRCVAPDHCQCEGGWRGDDCSSACDDKHWDSSCNQQCKCENGALCDPVKGACQCLPGFIGRYCEESCPAGTFGKGCLQRCKCGTGGSCDKATGECICRDGFTGTFCEKACPRKCQARCPCQNGGICRGKGICACPPGWTGAVCTERCPEGRFGPNCAEECVCHNRGKCDPETGQCQCAKGFTGNRCVCASAPSKTQSMCLHLPFLHCLVHETVCIISHLSSLHVYLHNALCCALRCNEECAAGTYGQDCKGVCDCANGARCYNIDGGCLCEPGFSGPHCRDRMCATGKYGMHCERTCLSAESLVSHCSIVFFVGISSHLLLFLLSSCHPMKGECTCQPGWAGLYCNETCAHGFYGHGCLEPCLCVNGGVCDSATGRCQCAPGFTGVHCESPCKSGTYGKNCSLECSCKNFIDCSPADGTCFCKEGKTLRQRKQRQRGSVHHVPSPAWLTVLCVSAGWRGPDCSTPCSEGTWGPGCNATCHCANGAKCNPADGSCTCTAGWQGARSRCSEPCSEGLWGRHCNQTCFKHCPNSDTCLRENGACVCRPGYWGVTCQNSEWSVMVPLPPGERESWGAIGGIVVLVILVVLLLALLLLYRRRQKDKQNNTPTVSFSTSRTVNSEYAVPDVPHSYHHYYSNPSYHTLSQNRPPLPHLPNNHDRTIKLFCSVKNMERERRGLFGVESNATLPADWKHHEPRKDTGPCERLSSNTLRYLNFCLFASCVVTELKDTVAASSSSLNSENPYATIKDLPGLPFCPPESSYMEMKSAVPRERAYTEISPPPFNTGTLHRERQSSLGHAPHEDPQSHYDLPVNSHIPGHYDLPPVRRPPSPSPSPRRSPQ
uniref:Platelet endothelial aggregation receptor 1 n=1 Tax=Seriola dumerili TaxID=41447 RepID=A0A3B4TSE5_SERDU